MYDRQIRLTQRAAAQVAEIPADFTLSRGTALTSADWSVGYVTLLRSGGLIILKALFVLTGAHSGTWSLNVPYLSAVGAQVFGTIGQVGGTAGYSAAQISAGVISAQSTMPATIAGDTLTIQGVL